MTQDPNKKTLRSFQCRDYLWETFEQMSRELECSIDYLINEAMRQYARSRNYGTRMPSQAPRSAPSASIPSVGAPTGRPPAPQPPAAAAPPPAAPSPYAAPPPPAGYPQAPPPGGGVYGQSSPSQYPPAPGGVPSAPRVPPAPPPSPYGAPPVGGYAPSAAPPPLPGMGAAQPAAGMPPLFLVFNGQKIPITKPEFVIGRSSRTADLPIKDGNVSRRHAAVVFQGGAYYLKDLGSVNGIHFQGRRIESKRIEEGDAFRICDYELRFTYQ